HETGGVRILPGKPLSYTPFHELPQYLSPQTKDAFARRDIVFLELQTVRVEKTLRNQMADMSPLAFHDFSPGLDQFCFQIFDLFFDQAADAMLGQVNLADVDSKRFRDRP